MPMTKLANLVDPEVMADMVSATLPKKIKFTPVSLAIRSRYQSMHTLGMPKTLPRVLLWEPRF